MILLLHVSLFFLHLSSLLHSSLFYWLQLPILMLHPVRQCHLNLQKTHQPCAAIHWLFLLMEGGRRGITIPIKQINHTTSEYWTYLDIDLCFLEWILLVRLFAGAHKKFDVVRLEILDALSHRLVIWGAHYQKVVVLPADRRRLIVHFIDNIIFLS